MNNKQQDIAIDVGLEIRCARLDADLTQTQLAKRLGTKQPSGARAERGRVLASIPFLARIAKATDHTLVITLLPKDERITSKNTFTSELTLSL